MSYSMDQLGDKFVIAELERRIAERDETIEELKSALEELYDKAIPENKQESVLAFRNAIRLLERLGY